MTEERRPSPVKTTILVILVAYVGLIILALIGVYSSVLSVVLFVPMVLASLVLPFALSIIAWLQLRDLLRELNDGRFETVDVLWTLAFVVFQLFGPLAWWIRGREARREELERVRSVT